MRRKWRKKGEEKLNGGLRGLEEKEEMDRGKQRGWGGGEKIRTKV